jgi:hypothetical protein
MSSAAPSDLNAASVINLIEAGSYPREVVLTIARGFLPLEQADLVSVLAYLAGSEDEDVATHARASLADAPPRVVVSIASDENAPVEVLARLVKASTDNLVLESLIRNRAVPDAAIAELAQRAEPALQDVIVINQTRILRSPEILDALLANPQLSPDARRRALETREEFFDKKARIQAEELPPEALMAIDAELADLPLDAIADLLEKAAGEEGQSSGAPPELPEAEKADPKRMNIWKKLLTMSVSQKVQLAFKGDKSARMILIRERNKLIANATIRNPRMSDTEIEMIAGMRNVEEDVLRSIGMKREWMSKYPIALALVRNPKAPLGVVLPLINRLTLRDLKGLKDDKGVAEVVRQSARRLFQARNAKQ